MIKPPVPPRTPLGEPSELVPAGAEYAAGPLAFPDDPPATLPPPGEQARRAAQTAPPVTRGELAALAGVLLAVSLAVAHQATSVFDFFDMSNVLDAGWRVLSGQRPYVDFFCNVGPVYLWAQAAFFRVCGFGTGAVLAHLTTVNGLAMLATWWAARRTLAPSTAVVLAALSGIVFYGLIAHPWYDQTAWIGIVCAAALLERALPLDDAYSAARAGFACGGAAAVATLAKINVGLAGSLTLVAALASQRGRIGALGGFALGYGCGLCALLFALPDPLAYLRQALVDYVPASRLAFWPRLVEILRISPFPPLLAVGALVWVARRGRLAGPARRRHDGRAVLLAGLIASSILSAYTSYMRLAGNLPAFGLAVVLVLALAAPLKRTGLVNLLALALVAVGISRMRAHVVWDWNPQTLAADGAFTSPALAGWRAHRPIVEPLEQAVAHVRAKVPAGDTLLVFPDATIAYALAGRDSYRGIPSFFQHSPMESSPPPGPLLEATRARLREAPPAWILIHHQDAVELVNTGRLLGWLGIDRLLAERYALDQRFGPFELWRRAR